MNIPRMQMTDNRHGKSMTIADEFPIRWRHLLLYLFKKKNDNFDEFIFHEIDNNKKSTATQLTTNTMSHVYGKNAPTLHYY